MALTQTPLISQSGRQSLLPKRSRNRKKLHQAAQKALKIKRSCQVELSFIERKIKARIIKIMEGV